MSSSLSSDPESHSLVVTDSNLARAAAFFEESPQTAVVGPVQNGGQLPLSPTRTQGEDDLVEATLQSQTQSQTLPSQAGDQQYDHYTEDSVPEQIGLRGLTQAFETPQNRIRRNLRDSTSLVLSPPAKLNLEKSIIARESSEPETDVVPASSSPGMNNASDVDLEHEDGTYTSFQVNRAQKMDTPSPGQSGQNQSDRRTESPSNANSSALHNGNKLDTPGPAIPSSSETLLEATQTSDQTDTFLDSHEKRITNQNKSRAQLGVVMEGIRAGGTVQSRFEVDPGATQLSLTQVTHNTSPQRALSQTQKDQTQSSQLSQTQKEGEVPTSPVEAVDSIVERRSPPGRDIPDRSVSPDVSRSLDPTHADSPRQGQPNGQPLTIASSSPLQQTSTSPSSRAKPGLLPSHTIYPTRRASLTVDDDTVPATDSSASRTFSAPIVPPNSRGVPLMIPQESAVAGSSRDRSFLRSSRLDKIAPYRRLTREPRKAQASTASMLTETSIATEAIEVEVEQGSEIDEPEVRKAGDVRNSLSEEEVSSEEEQETSLAVPLKEIAPSKTGRKPKVRKVMISESESEDVVPATIEGAEADSRHQGSPEVNLAPDVHMASPRFEGNQDSFASIPPPRPHKRSSLKYGKRPKRLSAKARDAQHSSSSEADSDSSTEPEAPNDDTYRPEPKTHLKGKAIEAKRPVLAMASRKSSSARSRGKSSTSVDELALEVGPKRKKGHQAVPTQTARPTKKVRLASNLASATSVTTQRHAPNGLSRIYAPWNGDGCLYPGTVTAITDRVGVKFDDGDDTTVEGCQLRACSLQAGDVVLPYKHKKEYVVVSCPSGRLQTGMMVAVQAKAEGSRKPADVIHCLVRNLRIPKKHLGQMDNRKVDYEHIVVHIDKPELSATSSRQSVVNPPVNSTLFQGLGFIVTCPAGDADDTGVQNQKADLKAKIKEYGGHCADDVWDYFEKDHDQGNRRIRLKEGPTIPDLKGIFLVSTGSRLTRKLLLSMALGIPCLSARYIDMAHLENVTWTSFLLASGFSTDLNAHCSQYVNHEWGKSRQVMLDGKKSGYPRQPFTGLNFLVVMSKRSKTPVDDGIPYCVSAMGAKSVRVTKAYKHGETIVDGVDLIIIPEGYESNVHGEPRKKCVNVEWVKRCLIIGMYLEPDVLEPSGEES